VCGEAPSSGSPVWLLFFFRIHHEPVCVIMVVLIWIFVVIVVMIVVGIVVFIIPKDVHGFFIGNVVKELSKLDGRLFWFLVGSFHDGKMKRGMIGVGFGGSAGPFFQPSFFFESLHLPI